MKILLLALTMAAAGPRPASAHDEFLTHLAQGQSVLAQSADLESAFSQAGKIMTTAKNASLTYAQVTRLREIAATARPRHRTIFREVGGSTQWRRLWASYDTHDEASDIHTIELSVRKSSLFRLYDRRYDFRVSPRTATATARVFHYRSSCIGLTYCTEGAHVIEGLDMRSPEVRELFREELDHWVHDNERSIKQ